MGSNLKAQLVRGTSGTFVIRTSNTALKFLTSWALARLLGADGFGVFNFVMAWITLLMIPALFGLDRLMVRELSVYTSEGAWALARGLLRYVMRATLALALLLAVAAAGLAWLTYEVTGRPALLQAEHSGLALTALYTLLLALIVLPLRGLLLQQQAAMQGLHYVVQGQVPEQIVQPVLFLALIGAGYLAGCGVDSPEWAMVWQAVTVGAALAASELLMRRRIPDAMHHAAPAFAVRVWIASAIPFAFVRGLNTLNQQVDSIMLGPLAGAEAIGLYTVVLRGTQLISLMLLSVNTALAPAIARLHAAGKHRELQRAITGSTRLVFIGALPVALVFILWGNVFLGLFGQKFTQAHTALTIMSVGQVINAASGSVALLLMMTGYERDATLGVGISLVIHVALNLLLIPPYGLEGVAVAASASMMTWNWLLVWFAWRRLRINTTVFGPMR